MSGDSQHGRKDPLPLSRGASAPEPQDGERAEPRLHAFGDEPPVTVESSLVVPPDLRAAHQGGGSAPIIAIAAFVVFCLCGAGYAAWTFSGATSNPTPPAVSLTPSPEAAAPAPMPVATPPAYQVNPPPTQPVTEVAPAPAAKPPATSAKPVVDQAAREHEQAAESARRAAEQAQR